MKTGNTCMLVYHYWPGAVGGAEQSCRRLAAGLSQAGHRCIILTSRTDFELSGCEQDGDVKVRRFLVPEALVYRLRRRAGRGKDNASSAGEQKERLATGSARASALAAQLLRRSNALCFMIQIAAWCIIHRRSIQVLHVHTSDWIAGVGGWLGARLKVPVVCKESTFPSLPPFQQGVPFHNVLDVWRRRLPFIAQHARVRDDLIAKGIPSHRICVIPNPVPAFVGERREADEPLVLWIGNASQGIDTKGLDVLSAAWPRIRSAYPEARLVLLGNGLDAVVRALFESTIESVEFRGYVDNVEEWIQSAWVSVLPSRREGMSNALLEAMAGAVPVVTSDIPGNRSVITHGETGRMFPSEDADAFAAEVIELLGNRALRCGLGQAAKNDVIQRFSMDVVVARTIECYRHAAAELSTGAQDG